MSSCFNRSGFFCILTGLSNLNRAFDGDVVAVELLPEKEWSSAAEIVLEDEGYDPGDTLVIKAVIILMQVIKI
jgi:hypothetical protein